MVPKVARQSTAWRATWSKSLCRERDREREQDRAHTIARRTTRTQRWTIRTNDDGALGSGPRAGLVRTRALDTRDVFHRSRQRASPEEQAPNGAHHLEAVQAALHSEVLLQGCTSLGDQQRQVGHGDRVGKERWRVGWQVEAVAHPLLHRRALRAGPPAQMRSSTCALRVLVNALV